MRRLAIVFSVITVLMLFADPQSVEARSRRGRGGSSPFVTTPMGTFPKSVYYADSLPPDQLYRFRMAEQQYYDKMNKGKGGSGSTAKKPTTKKKT